MKAIIKLGIILFLCFPLNVFAEVPEQLKKDFAPISGTIIMPVGDKYLVDLDASVNLREGDVLTLISPGKKIIHPDTKEVLGTLDQVKGFLQVTQIKSGYSYVQLLSENITPAKGDRVKRFEQIPTRFESSIAAKNLADELKTALPHLNWLSNTDKANPELIFILADNKLKVTNRTGKELRTYRYYDGKLSVVMTDSYQTGNFQFGTAPQKKKSLLNQAVSNLTTIAGFGGRDRRLENPGITQGQQLNNGIWVGPNLDGNPVALAVADFDGDGQQETAVAMEDHLQILRVADKKMVPVDIIRFSGGIHLLGLEVADIDQNGTPELYLSANVGTKLSSQVIEFTQGHYQHSITRIPWLFRTVDLPQEGHTLIAQPVSEESEHPFTTRIFRVLRSGNKLDMGAELPFPPNLNPLSFTPFVGSNNDLLYATISAGDYLHVVTPQGNTIWDSADYFGGGEAFFYNEKNTTNELIRPIFIQQRLLTLPTGEILAAQNDGLRTLERFRKYNKNRVVALKWDGFALRESWRTMTQEGYLADFVLADADNDGQDELVMAIKFKQKNLIQIGRSSVVVYELNQ